MCEEMTKLRADLDRLGIKWSDKSGENVVRTHFWVNDYLISVIHGKGTYGGVNVLNGKDDGFLEMMIGNNEPKGWLTASDVIERMEDLK